MYTYKHVFKTYKHEFKYSYTQHMHITNICAHIGKKATKKNGLQAILEIPDPVTNIDWHHVHIYPKP